MNNEQKFWNDYGIIYKYIEESSVYRRLQDDILDGISISKDSRILDVGCGAGYFIEKIINNSLFESIEAIDLSQNMLSVAKERIKLKYPDSINKINFRQYDLSNGLDYEESSFDIVFSNLVITYIEEVIGKKGGEALTEILKQVHRSLIDGGIFVWSTPIKDVSFLKVFLGSWRDLIDLRHAYRLYYGPKILRYGREIEKRGKQNRYNFFDAEQILEISNQVGFSDVQIKKSFAGQAWVVKAKK